MPSHQKQVITDKVGEEIRVWVSQDQYNYAISTLEQALEPMVEYDEDQLKMAHHAIGYMKEQISYALKMLVLADKS